MATAKKFMVFHQDPGISWEKNTDHKTKGSKMKCAPCVEKKCTKGKVGKTAI